MTNKTTMPEPVAYRKLEYEDGELIDVEYNGIDQFSFGRKNGEPLITTTQAESYADARAREALEVAASIARENYLAAMAGRVDVDEADDDDRNTEIFNVGQVAQALAYSRMEAAIRALIPATK